MNLLEAFPRKPWPHQERSVVQILNAFKDFRSVVLAAPTAAGKGLISNALANFFLNHDKKVIIYNNRRTLTQQSWERLLEDDIHCGVRAASLKREQNLHAAIQVASIQTDVKRVLEQGCWQLHAADLVIIDEAHKNMGPKCLELMQLYLQNGARILGLSGTPVGLSAAYKSIVVAATNSELRACGAHVPLECYSVAEMDTSEIKRVNSGEFSEKQIVKKLWSQQVVGKIYDHWRELNPDALPSLAAAPGVGESVWLSEQFRQHGHTAAHIDAKQVVVNGERYANDTSGTVRTQVLEDAKKGAFDIVVNCEVLQEGFDWPDLRHVILARPYGSLSNYLQVVGRGLRSSPDTGKAHCVIQDHGGNVIRHGVPDEDRDWEKLFYMDEKEIRQERDREIGEKPDKEPIVCPACGSIRTEGPRCHACGHMSDARTRTIIQADGKLVKVGPMFKPKKQNTTPKEVKQLDSIFFSIKRRNKGAAPKESQVLAVFNNKHGYYPSGPMIDMWRSYREQKLAEWLSKRQG